MIMTDKQLNELYNGAIILDKEKYIEKYSSFEYRKFAKDDSYFLSLDVIYEAANRDINEILNIIFSDENVKRKDKMKMLSDRYLIPMRTIENWCYGTRKPPDYILFMIQKCEGMFVF